MMYLIAFLLFIIALPVRSAWVSATTLAGNPGAMYGLPWGFWRARGYGRRSRFANWRSWTGATPATGSLPSSLAGAT
jgi:hypothetical protein